MQVQGGIFPTKVVIHNCSHKEAEWSRNIDLMLFRFPSRRKDGSYDIDLPSFATKVKDSLNSSGWCVVFAYGSIENKLRPFEFAAAMRDSGLTLVDIVVVNRPWWGGKRSDTHLALSHEYVFLFCKSEKWYLDRSPIYPLLTGDKYDGVTCPGNSWDLKPYNDDESWSVVNYNPAENYASDLAIAIMKMVCLLPGSVVMDPFMGGASGIEAAVTCGHSFIGFEVDPTRYSKYGKVLKKVQKRIEERDSDHSRGTRRDPAETEDHSWTDDGHDEHGRNSLSKGVVVSAASDSVLVSKSKLEGSVPSTTMQELGPDWQRD